MKAHRHPHPHIDPRQPRHGSQPGTNPPVFAWKPVESKVGFGLRIARDPVFADVCLSADGLSDPTYLPEKALVPGRYYWKWTAGVLTSEVFSFEISQEAIVIEVPSVAEWLRRFPTEHPRLYIRPEEVAALRVSRTGSRAEPWQRLKAQADALLEEPHELEEPPFLPDWSRDYEKAYRMWSKALRATRSFTMGAETLALAYLISGEARYGRAACRRMASVSTWDPEGSSHIQHNDETHMPIIWWGTMACDWAWDQFEDAERKLVIDHFRRRAGITYDHMHNRGSYGVSRFDSHAGREIVFLACTALVFHEHIPEARTYLEWLRPVLCGIWPIWAGDDGAWAEGPNYGLAYVTIMTRFATALKRGAGVDLYRRPFWKNHALWRFYGFPAYAECPGFGDIGLPSAQNWRSNANLVEIIDRETGAGAFSGYVTAFRKAADDMAGAKEPGESESQQYLALSEETSDGENNRDDGRMLHVFPAAGRAIIRTNLEDASRDIALNFRSSPYGAVSHSHAANNDFILHAGGKALVLPSGYYVGYGSDHHIHWNWHSKSHNCLTLSDASQLMGSHDSAGAVENAFEDNRVVYFRGRADASYADRAERCRRHVFFVKAQSYFVMIDEFVAKPGIASALQWNVHSWNRFEVDNQARSFLVDREGSSLHGHFMYHANAFFSLSEGWDPPPLQREGVEFPQQFHLRFTTSGFADRRNLGVVLCPGHAGLNRADVQTERSGSVEIARVGDDLILVGQGRPIEWEDIRTDAPALVRVAGVRYNIGDDGLICSG